MRSNDWKQGFGYQESISDYMTLILKEWLTKLHLSFKYLDETLIRSYGIIDLYLQKKQIRKEEFQLLGIVALLISSKNHEQKVPLVNCLIEACDGYYNQS